MKKKIVAIMAAVLMTATCLTGCNKQIIDLNYEFDKAYVKIGDDWQTVELKRWMDYEDGDQLQLTLKDGTVLLVHSTNLILYKGTLPR